VWGDGVICTKSFSVRKNNAIVDGKVLENKKIQKRMERFEFPVWLDDRANLVILMMFELRVKLINGTPLKVAKAELVVIHRSEQRF
jgi:hypothetical protein